MPTNEQLERAWSGWAYRKDEHGTVRHLWHLNERMTVCGLPGRPETEPRNMQPAVIGFCTRCRRLGR